MVMTQTLFPQDIDQMLAVAMCPGPAGEEAVVAAERDSGIKFPAEYRAFLLKHGAALFEGFEIYGLIRPAAVESGLWTDVRGEIERFRRQQGLLPLIPITSDGTEYRFYIAAEPIGAAQPGAVVVCGPDRDNSLVAPGFFEFVRRARAAGLFPLV